jgi:hypothetical protein
MNTKHYIWQVLQEHLLTKDYQELSKEEATYKLENIKNTLKSIILSNLDCLSKPKITYFKRSLTLCHRIPLFYGIPKVHKHYLLYNLSSVQLTASSQFFQHR